MHLIKRLYNMQTMIQIIKISIIIQISFKNVSYLKKIILIPLVETNSQPCLNC